MNLVKVSALNLGTNALELLAESILGGGVDHLVLDLRVIRGPIEIGKKNVEKMVRERKQNGL